jgi:hypothetical protein
MRTVRRQGLTFRITQPHGLRNLYLLVPQGLHKGRNQIFSGQHGILGESHCDSLMLTRSSERIRLAIFNEREMPLSDGSETTGGN